MTDLFGEMVKLMRCYEPWCGNYTQAWYEGFRMGAESQCTRQPPGADGACRDRVNQKTYDEYVKERADIRP